MLKKFLNWYHGYLRVRIAGMGMERFLNLCRNKKIYLWKIQYCKETYEFNMALKDYRKLYFIAKKTGIRPKIIEKSGRPFLFYRHRKRKAFLLGILLGIGILYMCSIYIWNITIEGQSEHTEEAILEFLKEINVYAGVSKSKINCQEIEEKIRLRYEDIGWVSAEMKGTCLHINLVETNMPVPYEKNNKPSHLVASHSGKIVSIVTRGGTPKVKKGDSVKKGDILISGVIEFVGDDQAVFSKEAVVSDGDIFLQTKYTYRDSLPLKYAHKNYQGSSKDYYGISVLGKSIWLTNPFRTLKKEAKYDIIANETTIRLSKSFVLPISFTKKTYQMYETTMMLYNEKEAKEQLNKNFQRYLQKIKEKGVTIEENNVTLVKEKNQYIAKGTLTVIEPVTEYREVKEEEWRINQTDELSGDSN